MTKPLLASTVLLKVRRLGDGLEQVMADNRIEPWERIWLTELQDDLEHEAQRNAARAALAEALQRGADNVRYLGDLSARADVDLGPLDAA